MCSDWRIESEAKAIDSEDDSANESSSLVVNKNISDTGSELLRRAFSQSFKERESAPETDEVQSRTSEPANNRTQANETVKMDKQDAPADANSQDDTLMADEFASEPTLGVGEIPPKYAAQSQRIKLLRSSLKKSTPSREELRMDLLHYYSTSFIAGEISGTFQEHLSRATFNEKRNALKRAGGRRRRAMKQLRKKKDIGREVNMRPPRRNNDSGPKEDSR